MLVLTIKPKTSVNIGDNVVIHNINDSPFRVGIDAPYDMRVIRSDAVNLEPSRNPPEESQQ